MQEIHEVNVERLKCQQLKDKGILEKNHSKNLKRASKDGMDVNVVQRQNHEEFTKFTQEQDQKVFMRDVQKVPPKILSFFHLPNSHKKKTKTYL